MLGAKGFSGVSDVFVTTTQNRGLPVSYWVDRCLDKIVYVSEDSNPAIRDQAMAFKESIRNVLTHYFDEAIKSDRTTLYNLLAQQNHGDMAEILRRLP